MADRQRTPVILDKSHLQGLSTEDIGRLHRDHQVLVPDILFYEILSSEQPDRSRCFRKLKNNLALVPNVGVLLKQEFLTREPSGHPSRHATESYRFNPAMSSADYRLSAEALRSLEEENALVRSALASLPEMLKVTASLFPDISRGSDKSRLAKKKNTND